MVCGFVEATVHKLIVGSDVYVSESEVVLKVLPHILLIGLVAIGFQTQLDRFHRGGEAIHFPDVENIPNVLYQRKTQHGHYDGKQDNM